MAVGLEEARSAKPSEPPGPASARFTSLPPRKPKAPAWAKACIALGAVLMVLAAGTLTAAYGVTYRYESKLKRTDILGDLSEKQSTYTEGPLNFLILGSDDRATDPSFAATEGLRSDTIMLAHVDKTLKKTYIVSIPRDSYVDIPASDDGKWQGGKDKINAAYNFGGPALTAKTVQNLTGVTLNGAFILDFSSVRKLVSIVGGVTVCIPFSMSSIHTERKWKKGCNFLTPDASQDFMRQRKTVPGGDFGRMQNQQRVILAVAKKMTSKGVVTDPKKLDKLLSTVAESVTVDQNLNLPDLALGLKNVRPENLRCTTLPFLTDDLQTPAGSSVELDPVKGEQLYAAMRDDTMDAYLAANPPANAGQAGACS
ncbi:LCP family protein [Cryptosporangium arvum]|uniref:Transcriptional attenuator, LytR family n=1 Tax=Cryptosporangium arvum DSM 44712 TaxID=927661 RepID=A0A010ZP48_9ACTN|nr:LCP family protein [Cryptosporangium arvum]EXG79002.1 transcriptional attenuator, LytR family [Cryptosporangium arvum DSM 44712]